MDTMDKAAAKLLGEELRVVVQELAAKHGVDVKVGGGSYDPTAGTFKPRIEFSLSDSEARKFAQAASWFDLEAGDYGSEFTVRGTKYRLVEIAPNRPKYPFVGERPDGRRFKFTETIVPLVKAARS